MWGLRQFRRFLSSSTIRDKLIVNECRLHSRTLIASSYGHNGQPWNFSSCGVLFDRNQSTTCGHSSSTISQPSVIESAIKLEHLFSTIQRELTTPARHRELSEVASYYFDGYGKSIRPQICILMARCINAHINGINVSELMPTQSQVAVVCEMIHTATLVHDDVIDESDRRRGKDSVNAVFGQHRTIIGGDFVLVRAGSLIARLKNDQVTMMMAQVLEDLVQGEFMQMETEQMDQGRFARYLEKTFNKTASLLAYSCKAVAVLANADDDLAEKAFQFGKHVGIAFQLVDDLLDFVSSTETMGKPVVADLKLGLATAPVLFAAQKFPELNELIDRQFSYPGDVDKVLDCIGNSDALAETRFLAEKYCNEAKKFVREFKESPFRDALLEITDKVLNRSK